MALCMLSLANPGMFFASFSDRPIWGVRLAISDLLKEIHECRFCFSERQGELKTPFVYSPTNPDILVVSEMPSTAAWEKDIGSIWAKGNMFGGRTRGAPHKLCEWLGMDWNEASNRFFWIQRANCAISTGKRYALQHCSAKFLGRAIDIVDPRVILVLGRLAAEYFFRFKVTREVMGEIRKYRGSQLPHDCIVLYHPSRAAQKYQKRPEQKKSIELARRKIRMSSA